MISDAFSLSVAKPIHMAYGGFCVTNNSKIANKLIAIRNIGVFEGNEKTFPIFRFKFKTKRFTCRNWNRKFKKILMKRKDSS